MDGEFGDFSKTVRSFLQARDPSILAWCRTGLDQVKVNLKEALDATSQTSSYEQDDEDKCIRVYLRIKGGVPYENLYQIENKSLICKVPKGSHSMRNVKYGSSMTRTYTFTNIFGPEVSQIEIFNNIVKPRILGFINGRNSTLFTYGASGSGKTFTIVGTPEEPGLIPRALEYIFRTLPKMDDKPSIKPLSNGSSTIMDQKTIHLERLNKSAVLNATLPDKSSHTKTYRQMQERLSSEPVAKIDDLSHVSVNIWVSFAEIYNESIYDLLISVPRGKQRQRLPVGQSDGNAYIKNLTSICVSDGLEAYQILQFGLHNLNYASTAINSHSSRSHSIFTIKLVQTSRLCDDICISNFNFCDLAGSERVKKTLNIGDRLRESNNINTSLLILGRCIENIRSLQQVKDKRLIPFRESKLTQLFQRALMGFENIEMIVNINPSRDMFDETHHALNFAAIAKDIILEEQPIIRRKNRFSNMMEKKKAELSLVKEVDDSHEQELEKLRNMVVELYNEIENNREEHEKEIEIEKEYVADLYKEYIEKKEKEHKVEIEDAVKKAVMNLRKQHCRELEELREQYENRIKNGNDSIINLDDSDSYSEDSSPQRSTVSHKENISALERKLHLLEMELSDTNEKLRRYQESKTDCEIQINNLKGEIDRLKMELTDSRSLLKQAEEAYSSLLDENNYLKQNRLKLVAENILLEEKYETSLLSQRHTCTHCDSMDSDAEDDTFAMPSLENVTQNVSKARLKEEDKKLY